MRKWLVVEELMDKVFDRYFQARYSAPQSVVASFLRQTIHVERGVVGHITQCCVCPRSAVLGPTALFVTKHNEADDQSQDDPKECACNGNAGHLSI